MYVLAIGKVVKGVVIFEKHLYQKSKQKGMINYEQHESTRNVK